MAFGPPYLHGSSIPGLLEGAPFHNDSFLLTFNSEANASGTNVYVGAIVTLATDNDFTCVVPVAGEGAELKFILGVAQTSGQLQSAIDVICRGEVTVICDTTVTPGQFLDTSDTTGHDGMVAVADTATGQLNARLIALQGCTVTSTPQSIVALLF
jgi:hypothetical protein